MDKQVFSYLLKNKPFLLSVGCIIGIIILTITITLPQFSSLSEKRKKVEETRKQAKSILDKAEELSKLSKSKVTSDYQLTDKVLPSSSDIPSFIESLNGLAFQSGLTITDLTLSKSEEGTAGGQTDTSASEAFVINILGTKGGVENFLQFYEKTYPLLTLENVNIANTTSGVSNLSAKVRSYTKGNPQHVGDVESPLPRLSDSDRKTLLSLGTFSQFKPIDASIASEATESAKRKTPFSF